MPSSLDEIIDAYVATRRRYDECMDSYEAAKENLDRAKVAAREAAEAHMEAEGAYYEAVKQYAVDRGTPIPPSAANRDLRGFAL